MARSTSSRSVRLRFVAGGVLVYLSIWLGCQPEPSTVQRPSSQGSGANPASSNTRQPDTGDTDAEATGEGEPRQPATDPLPGELTPSETTPAESSGVPAADESGNEPLATAGAEPAESASEPRDPPAAGAEEGPADDEEPSGERATQDEDEAAFAKGTAKLFEGWEAPQLVIVFSGEQDGYIEPCGCAGKDNQKGGLTRRHTFFQELAKREWPVAALDLGGLVRRFGRQNEIKLQYTLNGLRSIGYDAVAFGPGDLRLPIDALVSEAEIFLSSNVDMLGLVQPYKVIERGGRKVGVAATFGDRYREQINNDVTISKPADVLPEIARKLKEDEKCDVLILLSHAPRQESLKLAKLCPEFQLVVTAEGATEPPSRPTVVKETGAWLIDVGHKGMYVGVVGLFDDPQLPRRYQLAPMDKRFPDSPDMTALLAAYQEQLKLEGFEGLGVREQPHPTGREFIGSETCGDCHTKAFAVWKATPHAKALDTLVEADPQRHFDPECLSCHVTGWEPQRFFPFVSGYLDRESTAHLAHNGCENCHGPGSDHVAVETGTREATGEERKQLREGMRLTYEMADKKCLECHDLDNSPDYHHDGFEKYWESVKHEGVD